MDFRLLCRVQVLIFMTIRHEPVPRLEDDDRILVKPFGIKGFYRCVVRYGYQEAISQVRAPEHPLKQTRANWSN